MVCSLSDSFFKPAIIAKTYLRKSVDKHWIARQFKSAKGNRKPYQVIAMSDVLIFVSNESAAII